MGEITLISIYRLSNSLIITGEKRGSVIVQDIAFLAVASIKGSTEEGQF